MQHRETTVIRVLAESFAARQNCIKSNNQEWLVRHEATIKSLVEYLPSGSGLDNGVQFDFDASKPNRLVFHTSFHHMNDGGFYDGWSDHSLIVTPAWSGFDIQVTGRNRDDIKEYLNDIFSEAFGAKIVWSESLECYVRLDQAASGIARFAHALRHPRANRDQTSKTCVECC